MISPYPFFMFNNYGSSYVKQIMCIFTAFPSQKETENHRKKNYVQKKNSQGNILFLLVTLKLMLTSMTRLTVVLEEYIHWLREESSSFI